MGQRVGCRSSDSAHAVPAARRCRTANHGRQSEASRPGRSRDLRAESGNETGRAAPPQALSLQEKRRVYGRAEIPVHRYAFSELKPLLEANASPDVFAVAEYQPSSFNSALSAAEISGLLGKLQLKTDGDTSFEQLNCVGARPANDVLEGVLTVKKTEPRFDTAGRSRLLVTEMRHAAVASNPSRRDAFP